MNLRDYIIKNLELKKICQTDFYGVGKKIYFKFEDSIINHDNIESILDKISDGVNTSDFTKYKSVIVIGKTDELFKSKELLYFDNKNCFVVFYLINEKNNTIYYNDSWIFALGLNYRKYIKKLNKLIKL